eukprot:5982149-Prymnesium_polylepis.1
MNGASRWAHPLSSPPLCGALGSLPRRRSASCRIFNAGRWRSRPSSSTKARWSRPCANAPAGARSARLCASCTLKRKRRLRSASKSGMRRSEVQGSALRAGLLIRGALGAAPRSAVWPWPWGRTAWTEMCRTITCLAAFWASCGWIVLGGQRRSVIERKIVRVAACVTTQ